MLGNRVRSSILNRWRLNSTGLRLLLHFSVNVNFELFVVNEVAVANRAIGLLEVAVHGLTLGLQGILLPEDLIQLFDCHVAIRILVDLLD